MGEGVFFDLLLHFFAAFCGVYFHFILFISSHNPLVFAYEKKTNL